MNRAEALGRIMLAVLQLPDDEIHEIAQHAMRLAELEELRHSDLRPIVDKLAADKTSLTALEKSDVLDGLAAQARQVLAGTSADEKPVVCGYPVLPGILCGNVRPCPEHDPIPVWGRIV